jgi:hypothetical protein
VICVKGSMHKAFPHSMSGTMRRIYGILVVFRLCYSDVPVLFFPCLSFLNQHTKILNL